MSRNGLNKYELEVRDSRSLSAIDTTGVISSGCHVIVYDAGTKTKSTIYADAAKTAKTNDITRAVFATDTRVVFYSSASSHDIFVADDKGNNHLFTSITPIMHVLPLDRARPNKCMFFPFIFNADGTEVDTGLDLPKQALVTDVAVEVVTTDAGETVDIGTLTGETNADPNGFASLVSTANAGYPQMLTATTGSNEVYWSATGYGAQLATLTAGTDAAGDVGTFTRLNHLVTGSNAVSLSYTPSGSDTMAGYGYVFFSVLR